MPPWHFSNFMVQRGTIMEPIVGAVPVPGIPMPVGIVPDIPIVVGFIIEKILPLLLPHVGG